jgi:hypothetical protein
MAYGNQEYRGGPMMSGPQYSGGGGTGQYFGGIGAYGAGNNGGGGGGQDAGGGMSGGMWMAIIEKALGRAEARKQTALYADAARAEIPAEPSYLLPFIAQMGQEGQQLKDSKLGPRTEQAARTAGSRAASSRGLQGPLAASVEAGEVTKAQDAYDVWRRSALGDARDRYFQLVQQYMQALEARRQATVKAGYAEREAHLSKIPGIIGPAIGRAGIDSGAWEPQYNSRQLDARGAYANPNFSAF